MQIIKAFFIAFSIYSRIPVPQLAWKEEDMKYMLCFFPWVGAVIGICLYLWNLLCGRLGIGELCRIAAGMVIPLLLTGGIHVDGFLDTMDAFHSYQPREKKLQILKDSHIGAFAVIMLAAYGLLYLAALSEIKSGAPLQIVCMGFFLARCLSGIGAVFLPLAKSDGMLAQLANRSHRKIVACLLWLQCTVCVGGMLACSFAAGLVSVAAAFGVFACYGLRCKRELGGITGDTAGYFVLLCELGIAAAAAVCKIGGIR